MKTKKWTQEECVFLAENYYTLGPSTCAKELNRSVGSIASMYKRYIRDDNVSNFGTEIREDHWRNIVRKAGLRNISFSITKEDVNKKYKSQNGLCALSNLPITLAADYRTYIKRKATASIDRIDSNYGYTVDNIQWVHKDINFMKQSLSQDKFIEYCVLIAKNSGIIT